MIAILAVLAVWFAISVPVALLVGAIVRKMGGDR